MSLVETIASILVGLLVVAMAALGINSAFSSSKLGDTEQNLLSMRMQVQQMFAGSADYASLDNSLALNAGLVPKAFIKGSSLKNPFGGDITLAPDSSNAAFTIELTNIPKEECSKLAKFQSDAWLSIAINGSVADKSSSTFIADIVSYCSDTNSIIYTAR